MWEGARSYAKRFASPVEPTRGQRYSPVRLIQQVEAGDPVVLPFPGSVSQFATLVEIDGALEGMVRLALVQSDLDSPAQAGVRGPVDHEQEAFDAADFPQGGRQLVLARIVRRACAGSGSAARVPAARVATTRRMSAQLPSLRFTFTLPPTSGRRCFGTPARSNTWRRLEGRSRMRGTNA